MLRLPPRSTPFPYTTLFRSASHVHRAMWRYRDVRSFRPVIMDAGHIVETLLAVITDRKSTRLNSSHSQVSYAVFCLQRKHSETLCISRGSVSVSDVPDNAPA